MAKRHLLKESRGDNTGRKSSKESASTSAKRDAVLGVEVNLMNRVLHEDVSCANSVLIWQEEM